MNTRRISQVARVLVTTTLASSAALAQDEQSLVIYGRHATHRMSADQMATTACLNAFVAKLVPNGQGRVRIVMPQESTIFGGKQTFDRASMTVSARAAGSAVELASGVCTVARDSRVSQLSVTVKDAARLAALAPGQMHLVASAR